MGGLSRCSDAASFFACGGVENPIAGFFRSGNVIRASIVGGFGWLLGGELVFSAAKILFNLPFLLGHLMRFFLAILLSCSVSELFFV